MCDSKDRRYGTTRTNRWSRSDGRLLRMSPGGRFKMPPGGRSAHAAQRQVYACRPAANYGALLRSRKIFGEEARFDFRGQLRDPLAHSALDVVQRRPRLEELIGN